MIQLFSFHATCFAEMLQVYARAPALAKTSFGHQRLWTMGLLSVCSVVESQRDAVAAASTTRPGPAQNAKQFTYVYTYGYYY